MVEIEHAQRSEKGAKGWKGSMGKGVKEGDARCYRY